LTENDALSLNEAIADNITIQKKTAKSQLRQNGGVIPQILASRLKIPNGEICYRQDSDIESTSYLDSGFRSGEHLSLLEN